MTRSTALGGDAPRTEPITEGGVLGRMGAAMAGHAKWVFGIWLILLVALGAAAPSVFSSLAGAGWQANGSESVQVRELAEQHFGGNSSAAVQVVVHSDTQTIDSPQMQHTLADVGTVFAGDPRFGAVIAPQPGTSISPDGHTGILIAGANASTDDMVKAVDERKAELTALSGDGIEVYPTGASALWSDFNKANHDAMIQAELFSWPVTLAIMVLAFGSLVAAGLPLLLTLAGLVASAGGLVLLNQVFPISVWAMNFAMMFALAWVSITPCLSSPASAMRSVTPRHRVPPWPTPWKPQARPWFCPESRCWSACPPFSWCPRRPCGRWPSGSCSRCSSSCWPR